MNIGTFGLINIDIRELLDFNVNYEYGFVEINKVSGTNEIQTVSNSPKKIDLKLRFVNDNVKPNDWITEANNKSSNNLTIGTVDYGNFYIKKITQRIKNLAPYQIDLSLTLWSVQ